jgi:hypothetical protein
MTFRHSVITAVITGTALLGLAHTAWAQSVVALNTVAPPAPAVAATVDVSRLPISLSNIEKKLRQTTIREERDGLNLRYFVDVYAKAPDIVLFTKEDNLLYGPVPYGAPTHSEMVDMITPQEHRAPAADMGALFRWLSGKKK